MIYKPDCYKYIVKFSNQLKALYFFVKAAVLPFIYEQLKAVLILMLSSFLGMLTIFDSFGV